MRSKSGVWMLVQQSVGLKEFVKILTFAIRNCLLLGKSILILKRDYNTPKAGIPSYNMFIILWFNCSLFKIIMSSRTVGANTKNFHVSPNVLSSSHSSLVFHEFLQDCFFKKPFFKCYNVLPGCLNPTIGFELARTHLF